MKTWAVVAVTAVASRVVLALVRACWLYASRTDLERLAEACERAAAVSHMFAGPPEYRTETLQQAAHDAELLRDLARAIRAWRVTIEPEK